MGGGGQLISLADLRPTTKFVKLLRRAGKAGTGDYAACIAALSEMSASAIDLEVRSLSLADDCAELGLFLDMIADQLPTGRNFELLQAYLSSFLAIHEDTVTAVPALADKAAALAQTQRDAWLKFKGRFQKVLCLIGAFGNMQ